LHLPTQPNDEHDEYVMVSGSSTDDTIQGDEVEHELKEDKANDASYEEIIG
jgi:hypothetical protein